MPDRTFQVVDGYIHCGLSRYKPIEVVREMMAAGGVDRAVLVQHLGEFDNSYIEGVIRADPAHLIGIAMVDENEPAAANAELERLAASDAFVGVRIPGWTLKAAPGLVRRVSELGLIVMLYCREGTAEYLPELRALLDARPDCRMMLTHLANPVKPEEPGFAKHDAVFELAKHPGVQFQLSGMHMRTEYPYAPLFPLIEQAVDAFGVDRIVWGSNYPPLGGVEEYAREARLMLEGGLPVPAAAIPAVAGGNALRFYFGE